MTDGWRRGGDAAAAAVVARPRICSCCSEHLWLAASPEAPLTVAASLSKLSQHGLAACCLIMHAASEQSQLNEFATGMPVVQDELRAAWTAAGMRSRVISNRRLLR